MSRSTKSTKPSKKGLEPPPAQPQSPTPKGGSAPIEYKTHRLEKINVTYPTWCIFANQFIWGLDKTAYKCSVCDMIVSRKHLALAKRTVCSTDFKADTIQAVTGASGQAKKISNVFTIHLPHGAKKSMIMTPNEPLRVVLEKICRQRALPMGDYVPQDGNGKAVPLNTLLGKIEGAEITFTSRDSNQVDYSSIPPLIEDLQQGVTRPKGPTPSPSGPPKEISSPRAPEDATKPKVVEKVADAYKFEQELGNGAFSVVYQARHTRTGDIVAIKVLDKYKEESRQQMKLKREIAIHQNLDHPNIIKFHQLDEDEDHFYVVMELVTGGELFDQICRQKYYHEKDAAPLLCQVLQGIIYLHDRGCAHRDIKPENLLFKTKDMTQMKIADFGESKSFTEGVLRTYCGTPDYMAPEIIKGLPYGPEVDIWAIGVTAFVMIGGYAPFEGENDSEVFASILTLSYKYISPEWDHVGTLGKEFIDSCLKLDAKKRLTARQLLAHPFITKFCTPADCALPPLPQDENSSKKFGELDQKAPRVCCLNMIEKIANHVKADSANSGSVSTLDKSLISELAYMSQIIDITTGLPLEKGIYTATWSRLKDIHELRCC